MCSTPLRLCFEGVNRAFTEVATFVCFTVPSVSQCTLPSLSVTAHLFVSSFTLVFLVFYTLRGKSLLIRTVICFRKSGGGDARGESFPSSAFRSLSAGRQHAASNAECRRATRDWADFGGGRLSAHQAAHHQQDAIAQILSLGRAGTGVQHKIAHCSKAAAEP